MTELTGAGFQTTVTRVTTAHWHPCRSFRRRRLASGRLGALPQGIANTNSETVHIHLGRVTSICQNRDLTITAASNFPSRADQP
ncbi:hypothetical protein PISMIDRAFT_688798 [Pisolithus microcarpus 441]|uniref:Uncharacterized protein n=1 Tax=Pisolithus microcarpus 441 TaxID=765257 RepID=A0A0C9YZQ1_9AGAM|nr:hypothetical protein BKA83DRAFT_688798 [Pisolithus microcarpus]KIK11759.1 hypothetical protein PISMIDRAFT_690116 [Pisolithus microcarpus 441]KIK13313.1 hypothetical protein PISMIDRAFT_688798 [Pisolithus microcarpus 441]